jgi:hypothetical protein
MLKIPAWLRAALLSLMILGVTAPALAACDSDAQETVAPSAFTSPVDGHQYCAWVNNPHECDGSGNAPMPFAMPTSQPTMQPGMSNSDYLLLGALFGYGLGHHSYYYSDDYYNRRIGPAWSHYPGSYYGYGRQPVTRITNVNNYHTTVINNVNTKYATQEKSYAANPATGGYKGSSGKTYTGATVPPKAFSGTNAPTRAGGNATTSTSGSTGKGGYSPSSPSSGRSSSGSSGYSGSSSGKGGYGGSSSSSSGGSRSSGGGGRK